MTTDDQRERLAALEDWEMALSAYAAEASRHVTAGLAAVIGGLPAQRPVSGPCFRRLLELKEREEDALRRVRALNQPVGQRRA